MNGQRELPFGASVTTELDVNRTWSTNEKKDYQNAAVVTTNEKCLEQQHIQIFLIFMCLGTQVPLGGLYLKCGCNMRKITNIFDSPHTVDFPQH